MAWRLVGGWWISFLGAGGGGGGEEFKKKMKRIYSIYIYVYIVVAWFEVWKFCFFNVWGGGWLVV